MKKEFTPDFMRENCGCYGPAQLERCSFMKLSTVSMQSILESEIPLKDKFWFVARKAELTLKQKQELAIGVAEIVLEIYERRYPDNKAPREAIQAAKDYLNGTGITLNEVREKRNSAASAAYAASAASAAYAADAAYAAYAADAAYAASAADAAYAASAADAADAASAADEVNPKRSFQQMLLQYLMDFVVRN